MSSQPCEPLLTQNAQRASLFTQNVAVQKIPFHQPQIGPLCHIWRLTGEKGKSKEYDSYSDNRP